MRKATTKTTGTDRIEIGVQKPRKTEARFILVGLPGSELVIHKWDEKAMKMIKDKQAKKLTKREVRDPEAEYEGAMYRLPNGAPAIRTYSFKASMASAASTLIEGVTKTKINKAIHTVGELTEIHGEPYMREDMVRLGGMSNPADIRYRPAWKEWWVELVLEYDENYITTEQVVYILDTAGYNCGVGEMRDGKSGHGFGRFRIADAKEAEALRTSGRKVRRAKRRRAA